MQHYPGVYVGSELIFRTSIQYLMNVFIQLVSYDAENTIYIYLEEF